MSLRLDRCAYEPVGDAASGRRSDRRIEYEAYCSYTFRTQLGQRIKVGAENGIVTLSGSLDDAEERALAVATIESLRDVRGVVDELTYRDSVSESDIVLGLAAKLYRRLRAKANVCVETLSIEVKDDLVSLTGFVDNPVRKSLVERLVHAMGGGRLVSNELEIDPTAIGGGHVEQVDDASLLGLIKSATLSKGLQATVQASSGLVVLTGVASDPETRAAIGAIAQSFRGVKWVTNAMTVLQRSEGSQDPNVLDQ